MNSALRWKLVLAFVLVFFAGIACGFFGAAHGIGWLFGHHSFGSLAEHLKRRLKWELKLTPEQMAQISPIIDRTASQLEAKRQKTVREVHEIFQQTHQEIVPYLTPEQQARLKTIEQRHRHQMSRHGFMPAGPPP